MGAALGLPVSKTVRQLVGRLAASSGWAVLARFAHDYHTFLHPSTRPEGWKGVGMHGHAKKRALQLGAPCPPPASQKPCRRARLKCICRPPDFKPPSSPTQFEPLYTPSQSERSNSASPASGSTKRGALSGCSSPPSRERPGMPTKSQFQRPPPLIRHATRLPCLLTRKGRF